MVPEQPGHARLRPSPVDCHHRLLLDPYLCVGPGCEAHADVLFEVVQRAAALGITLCVERDAWLEASRDPDVLRRRLDLSRFEPLVKLDPLPLPSERDAQTRCVPARSETDVADLKLLGALHARLADQLIALDDRLHRLAASAGLGRRVLTPAEAHAWLAALGGDAEPLTLRELDPAEASSIGGSLLDPILAECEPFDPYLRRRLETGRGRVLVVSSDDTPHAAGVIETPAGDEHLELTVLASTETARGARVLEPVVSAALAIARRRGLALEALLPPHEETVLLLLESLGFHRLDCDRHGRQRLRHTPQPRVPRLADGSSAWILPLDAAGHDRLFPELAGAAQAQLFAVGSGGRPQTIGSALRKQVLLGPLRREPRAGDLLLTFHARAVRRPASFCLTAAARVERVEQCERLERVLELNASRPGLSLGEIRTRLEAGPVTLLDVSVAGRLERFLPLAWLKENGVLSGTPRALRRLESEVWETLAPRLVLA